MAEEEQKDIDENEEDSAKKPKGKLFLFIGIGVVLLAVGVGAGLYFTGMLSSDDPAEGDEAAEAALAEGEEEVTAAPGPVLKKAFYYAFDPAFIVNFEKNTGHRYLQLNVEVMTREEVILDALKMHAPMLRNNLLLLFGQQESEVLQKREGKEKLRKTVLKELQKVMEEETGVPGIESVFFTTFVMQ